MKKVWKRALAMLLCAVLCCCMLPPVKVHAVTTPATVTVTQAEQRLEQLADLFVGKYFTVNQTYCTIGSHNNDHDNCLMSNVIATDWCTKLVGMGKLDSSLFPAQYNFDGAKWSVDGWQCYGFANFAHWYVFARKNTDNLISTLEGRGPLTYETLKNARPGDVLRTDWLGQHSMVFVSCDENGFRVLDCNYKDNATGQEACKVKLHDVAYNGNYTVAITGVENYDRTVAEQPATYTLFYDANGGSGAPTAQNFTAGEAVTLSAAVPVREGYAFAGWATIPDIMEGACTVYPGGSTGTFESSLTLYAVWEKLPTYTISFNANGGTNAPAEQTKEHDKALTLSNIVPVRDGYTFKGWAADSAADMAAYQPGDSYTANSSATLYAVWEKNEEEIPAPAPDAPQFVLESKTAVNGSTFTVQLSALNLPAVKSLMIENFRYDEAALEFVSAELNVEGAAIADWDEAAKIATVAFTRNTDINGALMTLTFRAKETAEGTFSVAFDAYTNKIEASGAETAVNAAAVPGIIAVVSYARGDVNGDEQVNSDDSIWLLRHTLSSERYPINQSGDMNGDGCMTSDDAIWLLRHTLFPERYPLS